VRAGGDDLRHVVVSVDAAMFAQRPSRSRLPALACALVFGAAGAAASGADGVPARAAPKDDPNSVWVTGTRDPSSWVRAESPHFVVLTDTSADTATRLLTQLERLDELLRLYAAPIRKADGGVGQKLTLYYLDGKFGFQRFAPGGSELAVGLFNSCAGGVLGVGMQVGPIEALSDAELAKAPLEQGLSFLFEAYARHFLFRHTDVRAPAALIDGLAKYFSAVRFSTRQMVIGRYPTGIGRYFALLDEGYKHEADYTDVFAHTYAPDRDFDVNMRARIKWLEIEARAWTLAHYMLSTADRRARMTTFLDAVHHGEAPLPAFERSYAIAAGALSDTMWHYRLSAKTLRVELPSSDPAPVSTRVLSRAAGEFVLAEARRASCPGASAMDALLRSATVQAARMDNSDAARAGIVRIQVDAGDLDAVQQALPALRREAARDPGDADAAYWLGRAELRLAARDPALLVAAEADLARATTLRPGEPAFALARLQAALAARPEPDQGALDALFAAWRGTRDNNALARQAVLAYAWTGDAVRASHVLQVLSNDSRDPDSQAWAAQWRARLEHGVAPAALFAEMRRPHDFPAIREWTLDQDSIAREAELRKASENMGAAVPFVPPMANMR